MLVTWNNVIPRELQNEFKILLFLAFSAAMIQPGLNTYATRARLKGSSLVR